MQTLYKRSITYKGMVFEYALYKTQSGYTVSVSKKAHDETMSSSVPIDVDEKEALRLIKALRKSRVTPVSLIEAMADREMVQ